MVEIYYVYRHTNKLNGKQYIGITKRDPAQRWGTQGSKYKSSPYFWSAICKYGWDNFEHEILLSDLTKEEACDMEITLIEIYKTQDKRYGYNIMEGGSAPTMPLEVRQKRSVLMQGNQNSKGVQFTEERRKNISAALKGKPFTESHRKALSLAKKGGTHKPISQEARRKIADAHDKKAVRCIETGQEFRSIHDCARVMNILATCICACCKGRHKSTHGYHFEYTINHDNTQMPNDYPVREYIQANGNGSPHYNGG